MQGKAKKLTAGVCGLAVIVGTFGASIPAANATVFTPQSAANVVNDSNQKTVIDVFNGINAFRAGKGLKPVKFSVPISKVAQDWSYTMASTDRFYHNPNFTSQIPANYESAGEIIAARWDRSGQGLVNQWIDSPGHNAIMSEPGMNVIGIGVSYTDGTGKETALRYANYGTVNLANYDHTIAETYNSPEDYFAGKPALPVSQEVIPPQPTFTLGGYTIPTVKGVRYEVNGVSKAPGTHSYTAETFYDVRAYPEEGYFFANETNWKWYLTLQPVKPPAAVQVTPSAPYFNNTASSYQIPIGQGLEYLVNGTVQLPGVYPAKGIINITVRAKTGYVLNPVSPTSWTHDFTPVAPTPVNVTPIAPAFNTAGRTYTVPAKTGIIYKVNGTVTAAGTYNASSTSASTVVISATAATNYVIPAGTTVSWTGTFTAPAPVPVTTTPAAPTFDQTAGVYTVPATAGIQYKVNGVLTATGVYTAPDGIVTITAIAVGSTVITPGATTSWSMVFGSPHAAIGVTPPAPAFNATARTYTIPVKTGVNYIVNGAIKAAGTYAGTGSVSIMATAKTGYYLTGAASWAYTFAALPVVPAVKAGDLLAVDASGALWNYGNRVTTGRKVLAGSGWGPVKEVFVTDWNSDGRQDVVAQWKAGNLTVSYGTSAATLGPAQVIGTGWGSYELSVAKYNRTDKYPSIIAKDTNGYLWQYTNTTGLKPGARVLKGSGWKALQVNVLDWDKDGNMDIVAKNSAGTLVLYRTNGSGAFVNEARKVIGTGWGGFQIQSITHYTGTGSQGVMAKDAKGNLFYYGTGKGTWLARISEGTGWLPMNISSS